MDDDLVEKMDTRIRKLENRLTLLLTAFQELYLAANAVYNNHANPLKHRHGNTSRTLKGPLEKARKTFIDCGGKLPDENE